MRHLPHTRLKAAASTYAVLSLLCLPFILPVVKVTSYALAFQRFGLSDLMVVIIFPLSILLIFFWASRFQIVVSDAELSYRSLFCGTRSLPLAQIECAKTEIGIRSAFGPPYRLVITAKGAAPPIVINMKIFSRKDLQKLFSILHDKTTGEMKLPVFSRNSG